MLENAKDRNKQVERIITSPKLLGELEFSVWDKIVKADNYKKLQHNLKDFSQHLNYYITQSDLVSKLLHTKDPSYYRIRLKNIAQQKQIIKNQLANKDEREILNNIGRLSLEYHANGLKNTNDKHAVQHKLVEYLRSRSA